MARETPMYRDPEDLTDPETEVHPNIEARSFHEFQREERRRRLEALRQKGTRTPSEEKELADLEYKFLPVAREVEDGSFFQVSREDEDRQEDYSADLVWLLNNPSVDSLLRLLDGKNINLGGLEELVYYNLSAAIKDRDDDLGYELCRIGLLVKWAGEYGRAYLLKIRDSEDDRVRGVYASHYEASKNAILSLAQTE